MTDRNIYQHKSCSAVMGTLTMAQKAQKALARAAIPASVGKIHSSESHRGCAWSVGFSCNQLQNVQSVLASAGINVKSWEEKYDIP